MTQSWVKRFATAPFTQIVFAALMVLAYCAVQRGPLLYADTFSYHKVGAEAARAAHLVHGPANGAGRHQFRVAHAGEAARTQADPRLPFTIAGARSAYYGVPLYALVAIGSAWLAAAVQAFLTVSLVFIAFRKFGSTSSYLISMACLVLASSLPAFAVFLMPDFATAIAVLGAMLVLWRWHDLTKQEKAIIGTLIVMSCLFHSTHKLILLGSVLAAVVITHLWSRRLERPTWSGVFMVAAALLLSSAGDMLYPAVVTAVTGQRVYSPPFLTARAYTDGPGRQYLQRVCAADEDRFAMCRYRDRDIANPNIFLWQEDGIFQNLDYATRVRMIGEDKAIYLGAVAEAPGTMIATAAMNSLKLMIGVGPGQVLRVQRQQIESEPDLVRLAPEKVGCKSRVASCRPRIPPAVTDLIVAAGVILGLTAIVWMVAAGRVDRRRWLPVVGFLLTAVLVNCVVCGTFSVPSARYEARISWLIPMLALIMASDMHLRGRSRATSDGDARVAVAV